jgi:aspartate/methionine/tyrosine aminotransferase
MFSSRLNWDLRPNRISALLEARRRAGAPILDLTESNPTHAGLSYPEAEILAALGDARSLRYEPSPAGAADAREAVAAYYAARGASVPADRIVLTASTSEAYGHLFKLLADPGDEVLVPRPSYPLFEFLARLECVRVVEYPLAYDGSWRIDFEALEAALGPRARAIVVVNPNNPTGSFLKARERDRLIALAAERGLAIVADEVFSDYAFAPDAERVTTLATETGALAFSLSGLSKIAGLPQMKLGWIVTAGPQELRAGAFARLELIADTYLSVAAPAQYGAARLMEAGAKVRERISARVRENLAWLRGAVEGSALGVLEVEGGWYATLRVPRTRSEEEWTLELLDRDGVLVQPGFFYDFETEAFLVLSLLTPPDVFREGVGRLLARAGE